MRVGHHVSGTRPGLTDDALALGFGISANSARRTHRLLSCLLGVGPGCGQDLVALALDLGKTVLSLRLGRPGLREQLVGMRLERIRLLGGKLQNGPHPLTQSVGAGRRRRQMLHPRFQLVGTPCRRGQPGRELLVVLQQPLAVSHEPNNPSLQLGQSFINLCRLVTPAHDRKTVPVPGPPVGFARHTETVRLDSGSRRGRDASIPTCRGVTRDADNTGLALTSGRFPVDPPAPWLIQSS